MKMRTSDRKIKMAALTERGITVDGLPGLKVSQRSGLNIPEEKNKFLVSPKHRVKYCS
jgi:hypothetical protein